MQDAHIQIPQRAGDPQHERLVGRHSIPESCPDAGDCSRLLPTESEQVTTRTSVGLNVVIEGQGEVWIDDIRLLQGPLR